MSNTPSPKSGIDQIKLYTPGQAPKVSADAPLARKLSSNENLYGPSPQAIEAVKEAAQNIWLYPNVDHADLRNLIGEIHGLEAERIICGVGSDELLYLLAQAYAGVGDEIIMTEYGFEVYGIVTHAVGAKRVVAKETERRVDVDQILENISARTKLVYIANPANPTGTMLAQDELARLAVALPSHVVLVIDSAYAEFAEGYDGGATLVSQAENVFMTRTFSKLYGLGGLRVGWGYGPQAIIDTLNRLRQPFNLSNVALAGALAAMQDQEYAQSCRVKILEDRQNLVDRMRQMGLTVGEAKANFVLVDFGETARAENARSFLAQNGYVVRSVAHYQLPSCLRITIGTREDCRAIGDLLSEFLEKT